MDTRPNILARLFRRFHIAYLGFQNRTRILRTARRVAALAVPGQDKQPVVFFNASARLSGLSLNAAFSMLTAWSLRLAGIPVIHFVCSAGMSRCVLGTDRDDHTVAPPCDSCISQSKRIYAHADTHWFSYAQNDELAVLLNNLSMDDLSNFEYQGWSYGRLVLPSLRWILRRHHLADDEPTRFLLRQYILSAHRIAQEFSAFLNQANPLAVVIFNGIMFPEAVVRRVAQQRGIRVITHEVAFQPFSAFFTDGEATAYPIEIPEEFELSVEQNVQLDSYLEQRFQGHFTMAGIRFWPEMRDLDEALLAKINQFEQVVPLFTNVIFDTSQVHANTLFPHMFAWLDQSLDIIKTHPKTLFVIRAHPDEMRPGTKKQSRESVRQWVEKNGVNDLPNVVFIDSGEYISSYALIQRAKFVMVYNSSIGLEATLMSVPALCAGSARYTQYPTVFFPDSAQAYRADAEKFLAADEIHLPSEFLPNARRFLHFQLFRTSLDFDEYLQAHPRPGYVRLKSFPVENLYPNNAAALKVIEAGVVDGASFLV